MSKKVMRRAEIPPKILVTYYNNTNYMLERGYISEDEFKRVGGNILEGLGYPPSACETMLTDNIARAKIVREVKHEQSN